MDAVDALKHYLEQVLIESSAMTTMQAVQFYQYGVPEVLRYGTVPRPEPGAGEVLIQVHAAAVNPADWKFRMGQMQSFFNLPLPLILGLDVAGVVAATGSGVTDTEVGQAVYAVLGMRQGGYAEYALVTQAGAVAAKPQSLDFIKAASVPSVAMTAWQSLFDLGGLTAGQTLLVHGAAGGVGMFAVQFGKLCGAEVIATASAHNIDFLRELGADQVIDYNATRFEEAVSDVDLVLDTMGGETRERSWNILKPGGMLVSTTSPPDQETAKAKGVRGAMVQVQSRADLLTKIAELIRCRPDQNNCRQRCCRYSEAAQAQVLSQQGHTRGKIVLPGKP